MDREDKYASRHMTCKIPFVCQQGQLKPKGSRLEQEALAGGVRERPYTYCGACASQNWDQSLLLRRVYRKCAAIGNGCGERWGGGKALSRPLCQDLQRQKRREILRWYPTDITWCTHNHCLGLWNKLLTKLQQNKNNDNHFTLHNNILVCEWVIPAFPTLASGTE